MHRLQQCMPDPFEAEVAELDPPKLHCISKHGVPPSCAPVLWRWDRQRGDAKQRLCDMAWSRPRSGSILLFLTGGRPQLLVYSRLCACLGLCPCLVQSPLLAAAVSRPSKHLPDLISNRTRAFCKHTSSVIRLQLHSVHEAVDEHRQTKQSP